MLAIAGYGRSCSPASGLWRLRSGVSRSRQVHRDWIAMKSTSWGLNWLLIPSLVTRPTCSVAKKWSRSWGFLRHAEIIHLKSVCKWRCLQTCRRHAHSSRIAGHSLWGVLGAQKAKPLQHWNGVINVFWAFPANGSWHVKGPDISWLECIELMNCIRDW